MEPDRKRLIDLAGRRALVTGGSRGIGRATAVLLARAGADVAIGYRARGAEAQAVVDECRALGVRAWARQGDLTRADEAEAFVAGCEEALGGLDIFVGNHGVWRPEEVAFESMTDEQWRETRSVNLDSLVYTCRSATRRVRDGGRIVLVSSTAAQRGEAGHADYAATKGALISLVKSLCVELGPRRVTVNAVAPGWVETEMSAPALAGPELERARAAIPLGRIAAPEDVAGPIVFLCSDLAAHVTGEIVNVNGGSVLAG